MSVLHFHLRLGASTRLAGLHTTTRPSGHQTPWRSRIDWTALAAPSAAASFLEPGRRRTMVVWSAGDARDWAWSVGVRVRAHRRRPGDAAMARARRSGDVRRRCMRRCRGTAGVRLGPSRADPTADCRGQSCAPRGRSRSGVRIELRRAGGGGGNRRHKHRCHARVVRAHRLPRSGVRARRAVSPEPDAGDHRLSAVRGDRDQ